MSLEQWIENHTSQSKGFMKSFEAAEEFHRKVVSELKLLFLQQKKSV